jgi:hypothetical protein
MLQLQSDAVVIFSGLTSAKPTAPQWQFPLYTVEPSGTASTWTGVGALYCGSMAAPSLASTGTE